METMGRRRPTRYFLKLFAFGLLAGAVPALTVGLFSYLKSSDTVQHNARLAERQHLALIQTNVEQVLKTVDHSMTYFASSTFLRSILEQPLSVDQFDLYLRLRREINYLQTFDTGIDNFVLLSIDQGWYLDNVGLYRIDEVRDRSRVFDYFGLPADSVWTVDPAEGLPSVSADKNKTFMSSSPAEPDSEDPSTAARRACARTVNLVKKLPLGASRKTGLAVASIPSCFLENRFSRGGEHETVFVFNGQNVPILFGGTASVRDDPAVTAAVARTLGSDSSSEGQLTLNAGGRRYAATFRRSDYNDWTYVSLISLHKLSEQSYAIGWFTAAVCLALLALMLVATWIATRNIYKPLGRLIRQAAELGPPPAARDEFAFIGEQIHRVVQQKSDLENRLRGQIYQLRTLFMMNMFQGRLSEADIAAQLSSLGYPDAPRRKFAVLALQIDTLEGTKYSPKDADLLLFAINNIVEELIPAEARLTPFLHDQTQVTSIVAGDVSDEAFSRELYEWAKTLRDTVAAYLDLKISIGISRPHGSLADAPEALREAVEALKYRIRFGIGAIMHYADLPQKRSWSGYFPLRLTGELCDAIQLADRATAEAKLNEWFDRLCSHDPDPTDFEMWTTRLLLELLQLAHSLRLENVGWTDLTPQPLFDRLKRLRTVEESRDWFRDAIVRPMLSAVEERVRSQYKNISEQIIHIIHQECETDLTLESIAARLHYNPNYISGVFRKETGTSFSEYLAAHRHKIAIRYLLETDLSVKDISERLRYNNPQNFIRSFRKIEGITPGRYRELYRK